MVIDAESEDAYHTSYKKGVKGMLKKKKETFSTYFHFPGKGLPC